MCAVVPKKPANVTHIHDSASGQSQKNSAGTSESGTQIIVVYSTIASGFSVRDRNLMLIATEALIAAASSATSVPAVNAWPQGRTITITPRKPSSTAVQRRPRTTSPSTSTAPIVTNSGVEYDSATACASGRCTIAQKPASIETMPMTQRKK